MHYSPSTNGFYLPAIHGDRMPQDAQPIDDALYRSMLGEQIEPGPDGLPQVKAAEHAPAPQSVTMRQARLALLTAEKLGMVELALAGLPSPQREAAAIEWEFAATVDRESPLVTTMTAALGMTDDELDQLFMLASTL